MDIDDRQSISKVEDAALTPYLRKVTLFCTGGPFLDGFVLVVISSALVQLGPVLNLDSHWTGLIGAASLVGLFVGGVFFGYLTDIIGRRFMFTLDLMAFVVLSILSMFVQTPLQLVILRFLVGIAVGADYPIATALLAEFSPKKHRGFMLGILMAMWYIGAMTANIVGYLLIDIPGAWRWMLGSAAIPAIILVIGRWDTPESPRWLLSKNRTEEALKVVKRVYGPDAELEDLQQEIVETKISKLLEPGYLKRLIYVGGFWLCQIVPLFGIYTFGPQILQMFGLAEGKQALLGDILISLVFLVGVVAALKWLDRFGRRPLMIWSFAFMSLGMIMLAVFSNANPIIISLGFALYAFASGGPNIQEWVAPNELFPTEIRATAVGLGTGISRIGAATGTYMLPTWLATLGLSQTMWILAAVTFVGFLICLFLAPETKGLTLAEAGSISKN
ncbi:MFS transporter [Anoxybacterium hadale]|uniref:MFS transporter n=1 Tax=Anoxybacterium hadale TaxID=3408580 RepID=A0ACD1A670_9FIRM|nr:MFS transporter [Clostridiales bacterium]